MEINKSILITGVSTGIGQSIASRFLKHGYLVFGSVRKMEDAIQFKNEYDDQFIPLVFDITDHDSVRSTVGIVEKKLDGRGLGVLVNNAGIAKGGPLLYIDMQSIKENFEINVFGVINVIKTFAPLLGAVENYTQQPGKIINISSVSGIFASPFVAPYVGSKHALEGISGSLRRELMLFGIDVVVIGPGVVKTPIWKKSDELTKYDHTPYKKSLNLFKEYAQKGVKSGLEPERIANLVYQVAESTSPKTRYSIVPNFLMTNILRRIIPARWMDKIIAKKMGLIKN